MDIIYSLLKSMSLVETEVLNKHIRIFSKNDEVEIKTLKLIELVLKHGDKNLDDGFYCRKLYKTTRENSFAKLKIRVKNKIMDSLLLDVNLERRNAWDDVSIWNARARKKLTAIDLLIDKGEIKITYKLLAEVIDIAKEYELYPELTEALYRYKWVRSFREGMGEFQKITAEISFYDNCRTAVVKAKDYYSELMLITSFTVNPGLKVIENFLLPAINDLRSLSKKTNSITVTYYLKLLEMAYYNAIEDFSFSRKICHELVNMVLNNKPIKMRRRIGIAYDNLCASEIMMMNYREAVSFACNAQEYFEQGSVNFTTAKEYEFYANFYSGNYKEADNQTVFLLDSSDLEHGSFRKAKYLFLRANIYFQFGKFRDVLQKLIKIEEIVKDRSGWNVGIRLLTIMSLIELGRIDQAVSGIESMRKHIERSSKDITIRDRDRTIVKLLQYMLKEGFVFNNFHKNDQLINALRSLKSKSKEMRWEVLSHELIPFHDWVESKMRVKLSVPANQEISFESRLVKT